MTPPQRVHFVGIGGIHMSGLALILLTDGVTVSGSDLAESPLVDTLRTRGAHINIGHHADYVEGAELVVRTVAVRDDNPEIIAARAAAIPVITRAEMVARVAEGTRTFTVAGSHGKTTTTTMLTLILRQAGKDPSYILGGESVNLGLHAARGQGDLIVIEADEYGRAFHEYHPSVAVITNIERDHLDYYGSDEALFDAFVIYAKTLLPEGALIVGAESRCAAAAADQARTARSDLHLQTFALEGDATWSARDVREETDGAAFTLLHDGTPQGTMLLHVPGLHNVRNALAATAAAIAGGAHVAAAQRALATFQGVHRRFQLRGERRDILVLDDYAHHPTEVETTIATARRRYPNRRLLVLFQPHTYSRSAYLLEGFQRCFRGVDQLFLTDTYAAREPRAAGLSAVDLATRIDHPPAVYVGALDAAAEAVARAAHHGDLVITMGAGNVEHAGPLILQQLEAVE